jgi:hypothetical protein
MWFIAAEIYSATQHQFKHAHGFFDREDIVVLQPVAYAGVDVGEYTPPWAFFF